MVSLSLRIISKPLFVLFISKLSPIIIPVIVGEKNNEPKLIANVKAKIIIKGKTPSKYLPKTLPLNIFSLVNGKLLLCVAAIKIKNNEDNIVIAFNKFIFLSCCFFIFIKNPIKNNIPLANKIYPTSIIIQ